ncbi:MAG: hypothetical protein ABJK59_06105 [Erythrobacter sp.]|uniref:hypothetical protein n=1 Tax=Erythrobacter sp. TaxID=1042 RepID=UPI003296AA9B
MLNQTFELNSQEIDEVSGGGFFVVLVVPFLKGALVGAAATKLAIATADALDIGEGGQED